jgi:hypothetical protein
MDIKIKIKEVMSEYEIRSVSGRNPSAGILDMAADISLP